MADPGTALNAFDTSVECVRLLIFITKTAQDVKHLRSKCHALAEVASELRNILESNKKALRDEKTAKQLKGTLENIACFVAACTDFNVFQKTWEIVWRKKLPSLQTEMMKWAILLGIETSVLTRTAILSLLDLIKETQETDQKYHEELSLKLEILDELKQELDQKKIEGGLRIDFRDGDDQLKIGTCIEKLLTGTLCLEDREEVKVVGRPVKKGFGSYGDKGPGYVKIYHKIAANTSVHPFYGLANSSGQIWALFKDLRSSPSLGQLIGQIDFPQDLVTRLAIAHEITLTVEYLHSVEILVKRLSDKNVILVLEADKWKPFVTDLERARLFTESTSGGEYDVRYEAVEFQKMSKPRHSIYTDIWSLGILIWECVSASHPFGKTREITEGDEAAQIREDIDQSKLPWTNFPKTDHLLTKVSNLVSACCNQVPTARPTVGKVASDLFDIWVLASIRVPLELSPDAVASEAFKARIANLVEKAKSRNGGGKAGDHVSKSDEDLLKRAARDGDVTSSYLLGASIWYGVIEVPENLEMLSLVAEQDRMNERRARAARQYLEDAVRGGVKIAATPLMRVHEALMLVYQNEAKQHREMQMI